MQKFHFNNNELLEQAGLKITKQRKCILDALNASEIPLSAEQIFVELKKSNTDINLSTVYRNLDSLSQSNIISIVHLISNESNLYELNRNEHKHYFVCMKCKKILPISGCPLNNYEQKLEEKTGFNITGHKLCLYGYCNECKDSCNENDNSCNKNNNSCNENDNSCNKK